MTYSMIFHEMCEQLDKAGCDSPVFDASCLLEHFCGVSREALTLNGETNVPQDLKQKLDNVVNQRCSGRPLQYILGTWDFLTLTLEVGEGVLIPRPDTELLCEIAAERLKNESSPHILDLCAGSGCVGLGIASLCPSAKVTAVELSEKAQYYLKRNCIRYHELDVNHVQADVLQDAAQFDGIYNAIVSNPPYIPSEQLPSLMREVQHEPKMALDGGDGFVFYRVITNEWIKKLCPGGFCAVEVGIGQSNDVAVLFKHAGLHNVDVFNDYADIERVVIGYKQD